MMRLRRLDLDFFGHFTGHGFDFGPRPQEGTDFHIVYGPNEAGKTTTMEGYLRLLYGFRPKNEEYGFLHDRKTLKVSGVVEIDGTEAAYTRYANKLVDGTGSPVPQAALDRALAGLSQDHYRKLLCLDDDTIEQGGKEIIDSKGDIGRLLFAASAGISDLSAVLGQVNDDARALYLKGSGKTRFATLNKELDAINARIREIDVTVTAYGGLRAALTDAIGEERLADEARRDLLKRSTRLSGMMEALPLLDRVDGQRSYLAEHDAYPRHLDIDPEALVPMVAAKSAHERDRTRLTGEIDTLRATLDATKRNPDHLRLAEALAELDDLQGEYRAAAKHLPHRRMTLDEIVGQMRHHADDLGIAPSVDPSGLALSPAQLVALDECRDRLGQARRDVLRLQEEREGYDEQIAEAQEALDILTARSPESADVATLLDRFDAAGHAVAVQGIADAQTRADDALAAICIKGHDFDTPPVATLTASEARELVEALAALLRSHDAEIEKRDALIAEQAGIEARMTALTKGTGIVADETVQAALDERDALWTTHREALSEATATPFETAMRAVDTMAARRLDGARDLGAYRTLEADRADCAIRLAQAETAVSRQAAALAEARAPLDAFTADLGLPLTPTQGGIVAWLDRLETAHGEARKLTEATRKAAPDLAKAEAMRADLARLLPDRPATDALPDLLTAAHAKAEADRSHVTAVEAARAERDTLAKACTRLTGTLEKATGVRDETETEWIALVAACGSGTLAADTLFASLAPLRDLREAHDKHRDLTDRIAKMQAEQTRFRDAITALATEYGIGAEDDPLETYATLADSAEIAKVADDQWLQASEALDRASQNLEAAERGLAEIDGERARIGADFDPSIPTDSLDTLRESVRTACTVIDARKASEEDERTIRTRLGVADMTAARAMVQDQSADGIAADLAALETDLALAEERYRSAVAAHNTAEIEMKAVTGDADVARLMERRRTLELELQEAALDHLELRLGNDLAEEAIRRYRDAHRSAMLQATETAFADLTNGAYTRLTTQPDGQSETLLAIDATGASKPAEAMSKGTRFQLFLALRAAAYEQMAAKGAVLPFFCDDIFETFDEDRTSAACGLMARIGRTGQAIYLTHHRHVVDIARDVCGDGVTVHDLRIDR